MLLFLSISTKLSNAVILIREKYIFLVYFVMRFKLIHIIINWCIDSSMYKIILLPLLYFCITGQWFNIVSILSITITKS